MKPIILIFALLLTIIPALASPPDYERSIKLRETWSPLTRDIVFLPTWIKDTHQFVYKKSVDGGFEFILEDAVTGKQQPAFNQAKIAKALSDALNKPIDHMNLPFDQVRLNLDEKAIEVSINWAPYSCLLDGSKCTAIVYDGRPSGFGVVRDLRISLDDKMMMSPDNSLSVSSQAHNLVIKRNDAIVFTTTDGTAENFYDIESVKWSPNSQRLLALKVKPGHARIVTRVLTAPSNQLQPKVNTQLYPKPGDRVDFDQPVIIDINTSQSKIINNELFSSAYKLRDFTWRNDSNSFVFHYIQRGHQQERIVEVNALNGEARVLIDENSDTFINSWRGFFHDVNNQGKESIWMSERDGWAHLYLYDNYAHDKQSTKLHDKQSAKLKQQITRGEWVVRDIIKVDDDARQIYFTANGMKDGEDPYFMHTYRINFDGTNLVAFTTAAANHEVSFSDDMKYYVNVYSRVDLPNVAQLHLTETGALLRTIAKGDISLLEQAGFKAPTTFVSKGRDNKSDIWGLIVKPTHFDPNKKYPIIENIYAGPHDSFVPKSFWPFGYHSGGDKVIGMQSVADLGFIVVQIDGMGTANRSKAFHDVAWKNLGDSGFPDRILWHQAAAKQFPWYDIHRGVGIYGASAGGQSALGALQRHPDFYTVGVAFAGCFDNRIDKISWNEQWMGYPVGPEYAEASGVVNAHKLQGHLLLINGEQDSNVDPASTMQVVDALIKADKDFDLLIVPGAGHSAGRSTGPINYVQRRQFMFFVENLLNQKPVNWNAQ